MKSAVRYLAAGLLAAWLLPVAAQSLDEPVILVAAPGAAAEALGSIVLVVAPVGDGGHVGFIVNRPSDVTLGELFPEQSLSRKITQRVYLGGPVNPNLLFALVQRQESPGGKSVQIMPGLYAAYETAVVERVIGSDPEHARFVAGLFLWQPGELQQEVDLGAWLVLKGDAALVMRNPGRLWDELVLRWQQRWNSV